MSEKKTRSRSEIVRQRRRAQTQKKSRSPMNIFRKKPKSSYRELPPIIARGVVNDFGIARHKKTQKKRFHAVSSLPRIPGLPRSKNRVQIFPRVQIRFGWRLMSFFLVLLFGTGLYLFWSMPEFWVTGARITGNQRIPGDEINSVLALDGYPVFSVNPELIMDRVLQSYPDLASVEVTITMPNNVTVNVTEREPIILWHQDESYTWVDETGTAFRPRGEAQGLIVIQAFGDPAAMLTQADDPFSPQPFISVDTVNAIKMLAASIPTNTAIMYDPSTGLSWKDGRGWQVVFGSSVKDADKKIRVYQAMVEWLSQRGIRPSLINIAYPNVPYYRIEQVELQVDEN